jgi:hypothetical protein
MYLLFQSNKVCLSKKKKTRCVSHGEVGGRERVISGGKQAFSLLNTQENTLTKKGSEEFFFFFARKLEQEKYAFIPQRK